MPTPLLDLTAAFDAPGTLLAKLETDNATGSVKDRPVDYLLRRPEVAAAETLVEASGGNTGLSLAHAGRRMGKRVIVTMSRKMSAEKVRRMEEAGAEVVLCPLVDADSPDHFIATARRLAEPENHCYLDQFDHPANVRAHYETTGPEIVEQAGRPIDAFVAGVGTGGTISGVGRALKERRRATEIVLADPKGSILAGLVNGEPTEEGAYLVEGIGGDFLPALLDLDVVDVAYQVTDREAARHVRTLRALGHSVGGSSGVAIGAALAYLNDHRGATVCTLVADGGDRYPDTWDDPAWLDIVAQTGLAPQA